MIDRLALGLLGGHVGNRTDDLPLAGHRGGRRQVSCIGRFGRVLQLGQAEVEDPQSALDIDHDIVGLEVAMRDPRTMRAADGVGERDRDLQQSAQRKTALSAGAARGSAPRPAPS